MFWIVSVLLAPLVVQKTLVAIVLDLAKPQRTLGKTYFCYGACVYVSVYALWSLWIGNRGTSFHFSSSSSGRCQEYSYGSDNPKP